MDDEAHAIAGRRVSIDQRHKLKLERSVKMLFGTTG